MRPEIDQDGVISAQDANGTRQQIGQITLVRFMNPGALELRAVVSTPKPQIAAAPRRVYRVPQDLRGLSRHAEGSNVEIAEEFTNMIIAQRAYQAPARLQHW